MASILEQIKAGTLKVVPVYQAEIPQTRKDLYITGYYALNIHSPEDQTTGDWHNPFWYKNPEKPHIVDLAGEGLDWNTNPYLGDFGIYEGKAKLLNMGLKFADDVAEVYIADHFRAILDLLFYEIKLYAVRYGRSGTMQYATSDFLCTQEQKDLLLEKAALLQEAFEGKERQVLLEWIEIERNLEL